MTVDDASKFVNALNGDSYESFMEYIPDHPGVQACERGEPGTLDVEDETEEFDYKSDNWDNVILGWLSTRYNFSVENALSRR
jgi:hypothetical protein